MINGRTWILTILGLSLVPVCALAQGNTARPVPPTASPSQSAVATPERTTASFGDWVLRCEAVTGSAKRFCEVVQIMTQQGETNPIAQVAIGKLAPNEGRRLTVVLPTNIAIGTKPLAAVAKAGTPSVELTWQRCKLGACYASALLTDEAISLFNSQSEPGHIVFKDAADRDVSLPLSFRGLPQALAALAKEQ